MLTLTGTLLAGKYRVGNRLGGGGMGEVYEGIQEDLGRKVAIKVMSGPMANDPQLLARFQLEAKAVAALGHPHIVAVTDFQDNQGEPPFIVMERLVGESLGELLEREPMVEPARACRIAEQTLSALAAAHEAGLVHRDVKPDNIFLCRTDTNAEIVKLLDFGVAKAMEAQPHGKLTSTGAIVGTLVYMAPEQARGEPEVTGAADMFALGCVLYECLAGVPAFCGDSALALRAKVLLHDPPPLGSVAPRLPGPLAALVMRLLAREVERRPVASEVTGVLAEIELETGTEIEIDGAAPTARAARDAATDVSQGAALIGRNAGDAATEVSHGRAVACAILIAADDPAVEIRPHRAERCRRFVAYCTE